MVEHLLVIGVSRRPPSKRQVSPYTYSVILRLSVYQVDALDEIARQQRTATGKKVKRTHVLRQAVDRLLEEPDLGRDAVKIPPVPLGKLRMLVDQGFLGSEQSGVEYAIGLLLKEVDSSLDDDAFERRLLRAKIRMAEADRRRKHGDGSVGQSKS